MEEKIAACSQMDALLDSLNNSVPTAESEYMGNDGVRHCSVCHKATETAITHPFTGETKLVRCICDCKLKELEAHKEKERREEIERQRRVCFEESNMANWSFANDDMKNPKRTEVMKNYVNKFTEFRQEGKGLLLYGTVGTGKSFMAACVANALIDKGYTAYMTNFSRLTNKIQGMFDGRQEYIDSLNRYSLLIIDDLGAERKSEYMVEQVFNIIDARYRSGLPFIVTSNLTWQEISKPQEVNYSRIYDRILERCVPIEVSGVSRRRQGLADSLANDRERLGL